MSDEIHTGLSDCGCLACCRQGADCPTHGHIHRKLARGDFAWQKELAAMDDETGHDHSGTWGLCNGDNTRLDIMPPADPHRQADERWRERIGELDMTDGTVSITVPVDPQLLRDARDLARRIEAVIGVKP